MFHNHYLTPPRSNRKQPRHVDKGIFSGRHKIGGFYEDFYTKRNSEEEYQWPTEKCESETSSDEEEVKSYQAQYGSYNKKAQALVSGIGPKQEKKKGQVLVGSSESEGESDDEQQQRTPTGLVIIGDSDTEQTDAHPFRIAPKLNSKRSIPHSKVKKSKLPKQHGLSSRAYTLEEEGGDTNDLESSAENDGDDEDEDLESSSRVAKKLFSFGIEYEGPASYDKSHVEHSDDFEDEVVPLSTRGQRRRGFAYRPAHRIPIKQQLEERIAERKRVGKDRRREEAAKKAAARAEKSNRKAGRSKKNNVGKVASRSVARLATAVVVVDNSEVDFSEYQRFGTPIDLTRSDGEIDISEYQRFD